MGAIDFAEVIVVRQRLVESTERPCKDGRNRYSTNLLTSGNIVIPVWDLVLPEQTFQRLFAAEAAAHPDQNLLADFLPA